MTIRSEITLLDSFNLYLLQILHEVTFKISLEFKNSVCLYVCVFKYIFFHTQLSN